MIAKVHDDSPPRLVFCCPACDAHDEMVVIQPDPLRPAHLLGACTECKAWYLIRVRAAYVEILALLPVPLPPMNPLRSAIALKHAEAWKHGHR